jgi:spore germination protein Q
MYFYRSTPGYPPAPVAMSGSEPLATEESYIENILRLNLGKIATIYMTFENNKEWNAKIFKGRLEAAGRDHIIISDPITGMRYLLLMVNLDYVTFDEPLNYMVPGVGAIGVSTS